MFYHKHSQSFNPLRFFGCCIFLILLISATASGAFLRNVPQIVSQPDGDVLNCLATGDEFFNWLHDESGFTIIQDHATGYYVYAQLGDSGDLIPTPYIAGRVDPKVMGLRPRLLPSLQKRLQIRSGFYENEVKKYLLPAPTTGTINNIVIFIRFSDESEFTDPISTYSSMFNSSTGGDNSEYNYFREVSYNALTVSTTFYPAPGTTVVSYQNVYTRNYYKPYDALTNPIGYQGGDDGTQRRDREHILLKNAVNAVSSQIPSGLVVDGDGDGYVDNICFIVSGSPMGWASLLWPHQWSLYSQTAYINSKRVGTYNFQLQTSLLSSGVGVLCHEMFHSLGSPDLYHYSMDGRNPVYTWDVMEYDQNPPQHMGAYMKYRYGHWVSSIPTITTSGVYSLNPLTSSTNNCFKIASPNTTTEYFVVEYRRKTGTFEYSIPGSGLLVYRINTARDGQGNASGPPDEVYIYRPNGTLTVNGSPWLAHFSSAVGRTAINNTTNPSCFLSDGQPGGLDISGIGLISGTISFTVTLSAGVFSVSSGGLYSWGPVGGPFQNKSKVYTLQNTGALSFNWTASPNVTWLALSSSGGTLAAGGTTTVTVSIGSAANSLAAGTYYGKVVFARTGGGSVTRNFTLKVNPRPGVLSVSTGDLYSWGPAGGPFKNTSKVYTLQNTGGLALNWTASKNVGWLALSSSGGTLAAGASTTVTVSIYSTVANSLAAGTYSGKTVFTKTGGGSASRNATLVVK